MTLLDLILTAVVVVLAFGGLRAGAASLGLSLAGLLIGARGGAYAASWLAGSRLLEGVDGASETLVQVGAVLAGALFGAGVGRALGVRLAAGLRRIPVVGGPFGALNALGGAFVGAGAALALIWLGGLSALQGPVPEARQAAEDSRLIRALEERVPEGPVLGALVSGVNLFATPAIIPEIAPDSLPGVPRGVVPEASPGASSGSSVSEDSTPQAGVSTQEATRSTVRVVASRGISGSTGSGWVAAPDLVVTNAHVVEDASDVVVQRGGGWRQFPAEVELADRRADVAVLRVDDLGLEPLPLAQGEAGEPVAALGYPGGGPFEESTGRLGPTGTTATTNASTGRLYGRRITGVQAEVSPGSSGGPVVDAEGRVVATVFAEAARGADIAYAIPSSVTGDRVDQVTGSTA